MIADFVTTSKTNKQGKLTGFLLTPDGVTQVGGSGGFGFVCDTGTNRFLDSTTTNIDALEANAGSGWETVISYI